MEEKQMTGQEGLALINQMIGKARNEINDNGLGWLLWGAMIFLASMTTYFIIEFRIDVDLYIGWNIFGLIAVPAMIYQTVRRSRNTRVKTYVDDLLYLFDIGFAVCIFVVIISINVGVPPGQGFGYFLMVYAFLMLVQGGAIRFRPLYIGAIINWTGAIAIFYINDFRYDMLVTAGAVFIGYIIPGLMLRRQYARRTRAGLSS